MFNLGYIKQKGTRVRMYSFRKEGYRFYLKLFKSISYIYLNNLYGLLQTHRFNLFCTFVQLFQQITTVSNGLISNTINTEWVTVLDNYFKSNTSSTNISYKLFGMKNIYLLCNILCNYIYMNFIILSIPSVSGSNIVSLPKKTKSFTVLRSPHTDKKSREQFKLVQYSHFFMDRLGIFNLIFNEYKILLMSSLLLQFQNTEIYTA